VIHYNFLVVADIPHHQFVTWSKTVVLLHVLWQQLLIAIRSSLIVCDHVRSKTRLITIITKLGIIYIA